MQMDKENRFLYILNQLSSEEQAIHVINYKSKKLIAKYHTKNDFNKILNHRSKSKHFVLFSPLNIKLFEIKVQNKNILQKQTFI